VGSAVLIHQYQYTNGIGAEAEVTRKALPTKLFIFASIRASWEAWIDHPYVPPDEFELLISVPVHHGAVFESAQPFFFNFQGWMS